MRSSRVGHSLWIGAALVVVLALSASACRQVDLPDGTLRCSTPGNECPSPYQCRAGYCYQHASDAGGVGGGGGAKGEGGKHGGVDGGAGRLDGAAGHTPTDGGSGDAFIINPCDGGAHVCSGSCVDNGSVDHCGTLCAACAQAAGTTATCDGKTCDFVCNDTTQKKCGTKCVSGCCTDDDCPMQNGQSGKCDTSTNSCSYNCSASTKPCGTACIDPGACCINSDCQALTGEAATCNTSTYACNYVCTTGYKSCSSDATCVLTSGCCADSECAALAGPGQAGTCNATHTCDFNCTNGNVKCGQLCISSSSCCLDSDCGAQAGKVGLCDSSTHQCNYTCSSGQKPCGTTCIATGSCCANADCTPATGQVGTCGSSGTCSYACANGYKTCAGSSTCVPTAYCCTSTDCAPGTGQTATCTVATGTCSYACANNYKGCGTNACIATSSCCTNADCTPPTGQVGTCNAGTGMCQFSCANGYKPCGTGVCIPTGSCCSNTDCVPTITGQVGTCNALTGACSFACGNGLKNCNNTSCIATALCCTTADCAPLTGATPFCNSANQCTYTCNNNYLDCGGGLCVATPGCCTVADCASKAGATATCGASHTCSYSCGTGLTDCGGGTCVNFSSGGCCSPGDCASKTNATATCNSVHQCAYSCAGGLLDCGGGVCVTPPGCCSASDCAARSDATISCNTTHQCVYACNATALKLGCQCSSPGASACNGADMKLPVTCTGGQWVAGTSCSSTQNCDQTDGTCHAIVTQCVGHAPGYTFCGPNDTPTSCGADLTTTTTAAPCTGKCLNGVCQAPTCGDGKLESGEECDDGNTTPLDGCEPTTCHISRVVSLSLGEEHSCALLRDGYVRCWGGNQDGQLGLGHTNIEYDLLPDQLTNASGGLNGPISLGDSATAIATGDNHTCAILATNGAVRCWGANDSGQLGLGNTNPTPTSALPSSNPTVNLGGTAAIAIAAGGDVTCAILQGGAVRCWGDNSLGDLGLGSTTAQTVTMPVSLGVAATAISVGDHVCALLSNNTLRCWGYNGFGELGLGNTTEVSFTMVPSAYATVAFPAGRTPLSISAGGGHGCARMDNSQLQCWGWNAVGQLGLGSTTSIGDNESPTAGQVLTGTSGVSSVVTGTEHTCTLLTVDGSLRCWGLNSTAQLGLPNLTNQGSTATTIPAMLPAITFTGATVASVYTGDAHTCVLLSTGKIRCWGLNDQGQLGLGYASGATLGTPDYVGGSATSTPDMLPSVAIISSP